MTLVTAHKQSLTMRLIDLIDIRLPSGAVIGGDEIQEGLAPVVRIVMSMPVRGCAQFRMSSAQRASTPRRLHRGWRIRRGTSSVFCSPGASGRPGHRPRSATVSRPWWPRADRAGALLASGRSATWSRTAPPRRRPMPSRGWWRASARYSGCWASRPRRTSRRRPRRRVALFRARCSSRWAPPPSSSSSCTSPTCWPPATGRRSGSARRRPRRSSPRRSLLGSPTSSWRSR